MTCRNSEGYPDPTAGEAVTRADRPPEAVCWLIKAYKDMASLLGFEIVGRVTLRDKRTKREWR